MIRSSRMVALTKPSRFGLVVVQEFFGQVRTASSQDTVVAGDLVRFAGCVHVFVAYENGEVLLEPHDQARP